MTTDKTVSLRDALRSELDGHHANTEAAFELFDLTTRAGYTGFLRSHLLSLSTMKSVHAEPNIYGLDFQHLENEILKDLEAINAPPLYAPLKTHIPTDPLGVSYVVSGSHFGSQFLRKKMRSSRDLPEEGCYRYLESSHLKNVWKNILPSLTAGYLRQENLASIKAAAETFLLFGLAAEQIVGTTGKND
ncbi:hypothetical protein [Ponticaulis sp.]|uniref:hypothetical protein n=1 Tax=Ponticaulis sp. TaxID=2020902 RepID=UPI00262E9C09|nr:hypothetical protein [Ponticaulis sp.]MDF1679859.1 hypothetical protein [Ponticaulis sp.]